MRAGRRREAQKNMEARLKKLSREESEIAPETEEVAEEQRPIVGRKRTKRKVET